MVPRFQLLGGRELGILALEDVAACENRILRGSLLNYIFLRALRALMSLFDHGDSPRHAWVDQARANRCHTLRLLHTLKLVLAKALLQRHLFAFVDQVHARFQETLPLAVHVLRCVVKRGEVAHADVLVNLKCLAIG